MTNLLHCLRIVWQLVVLLMLSSRLLVIVVSFMFLCCSWKTTTAADDFRKKEPLLVPTNHHEDIIQDVIDYIQESQTKSQRSIRKRRPHVTLSFAQSLDAKLAPFLVSQSSIIPSGTGGENDENDDKNVSNNNNGDIPNEETATRTTTTNAANARTTASNWVISGPESMQMTHAIRSIHDGILVGGRTLSTDNPRLTNRLWRRRRRRQQQDGPWVNDLNDQNSGDDHASQEELPQPRPIVLDPTLRHISKLVPLDATTSPGSSSVMPGLKAKRLLVFCANNCTRLKQMNSTMVWSSDAAACDNNNNNGTATPYSQYEIVPCSSSKDGLLLDLDEILGILQDRYGMRSVMIEGGALVLGSFFEQGLFDCLCVTIAPRCWIGQGIGISTTTQSPLQKTSDSEPPLIRQLGNDVVVVTRCNYKNQ
ncbi:hypothetical protein ACA910_000528 [Epithemia clementina (nom. ined.)]